MHYENDGRYLLKDESPEGENGQKKQKNNVGFYQTETSFSSASSRSYKLLAVRTLLNLHNGAKLFLDYGKDCAFNY